MITPNVINVFEHRCRLQLRIPDFFEGANLANIRKVFKMLMTEPQRNEDTIETLNQFFLAWRSDLKNQWHDAKAVISAKKQDADANRRVLVSLVSTVEANIAQAERWIAHVKATPKSKRRTGALTDAKKALKIAQQPKTNYQLALSIVKRSEVLVKRATSAMERCDKVINEYNKIIGGRIHVSK